ncbi:formiminotetrahydrofolate cyclodeaminase [Sporomusaceae bacterium BoRhaA]|nr:formiminotetrahydrofolate cyclodeaminase [Pelorhabdus rhamnosifermentans]
MTMMKLVDLSVQEFVTQLANPNGGPGGGSAAALLGLSGMALLQMALGRLEDSVCQQKLAAFIKELMQLIDEDQRAYAAMAHLLSHGKEDKLPNIELEQAVLHAIEVPHSVSKACVTGLNMVEQAICKVPSEMLSELLVAAEALQAGVASSAMNMRVNLVFLQDSVAIEHYEQLIAQYREQGKKLLKHIDQSIVQQQRKGHE